MKRRDFLKVVVAVPAAPMLAHLPAAAEAPMTATEVLSRPWPGDIIYMNESGVQIYDGHVWRVLTG